MSSGNIRNFVVISHIDHGKSTLADRFLEITNTVESRQMKEQYLDQLELERERGITIKMAPVRMFWHPHRGLTQTDTRINAECKLLYEDITYKIRGAIFTVKKNIGLGHKESIYQKALEEEFRKIGLSYEKEKILDVFYNDKKLGVYRPDFVIEEKVILEIKALQFVGKNEEIQVWNYLKSSPYKLALLINFGGKDVSIKRIVYDTSRFPRQSASSPRESAKIEYILNLIDTPGHPDFSYEVSRALAAVEGAILLVDATQGIQAQTLATFHIARKAGLKIIGALNKVDLLSADKRGQDAELRGKIEELANLIGCKSEEIHKISARTGKGVEELLKAVIEKIPPPQNYADRTRNNAENIENIPRSSALSQRESAINARALIFDSFYDNHKGIIASVRIFSGEINNEDEIYLIAANAHSKIKEIGYFFPKLNPTKKLTEGEIGYIATGIKDPEKIKIGDTAIAAEARRMYAEIRRINFPRPSASSQCESASPALPGYKEPKSVVFVSFYPEESDDYENFKKALQKLKLNDSALKFEPDFNEILGRGFKGGFLGKLHFEITAERLEKEFKIRTINSFPSVAYKVGSAIISNPKDLPDDFSARGGEIQEPMVKLEIIAPMVYLGGIFQLAEIFRMSGIQAQNKGDKVLIDAKMPLAELISDFDDKLKSVSSGFASFSYELIGYQKADLKKLEILVAGEPVAGLIRIFPKKNIESEARKIVERLKKILPRQQFSQAIQAVAGGRIIARETLPALKKDVAGYLYGGDRTRKMKLWKKQKQGKKKLKTMGRVRITAETFKKMIQ